MGVHARRETERATDAGEGLTDSDGDHDDGDRDAEVFAREYRSMPKISVEVPQELLSDLDDHVGEDGKFVNRSEAIRASVRKTLDLLDEIDERQGRRTDEH